MRKMIQIPENDLLFIQNSLEQAQIIIKRLQGNQAGAKKAPATRKGIVASQAVNNRLKKICQR